MHFAIYLPPNFYAGVASFYAEAIITLNEISQTDRFTFEYVARSAKALSRSGVAFPVKQKPTQKIDVLVLLSGLVIDADRTIKNLDEDFQFSKRLIDLAWKKGATVAGTCGSSLALAKLGYLDGKKATVPWWMKKEAQRLFPKVRWEPSRMIVKQGRLYTSGGAYAGFDLLTRLLIDMGYRKEEREIRKLLVLPPARHFQSPYEIPTIETDVNDFEKTLAEIAAKENIKSLSIPLLATELGMSTRTLTRRFLDEIQSTPGKWIQEKRIEMARTLLENSKLTVSEICFRVGYEDVSSFSRLFAKVTGMTPGEFRKQIRSI